MRDLIVVPHLGKNLTVSLFGPNKYIGNLSEMQRDYSHESEGLSLPKISFREPKTQESISVASYGFGENGQVDAKRDIFNSRWLQAGRIVKTREGVIANPILDKEGNEVLNSTDLEALKTNSRKIQVGNGHIYLGENDFGFAEYETFQRGVQDCDTFAQGGLARVIEHTEGPAEKLSAIASSGNYPISVNVGGFENLNPSYFCKVLSLSSSRCLDVLLNTFGYWYNDGGGGAFGVLK